MVCCLLALGPGGCGLAVRFASDQVQEGDRSRGVVYYVGGAGPVGNVGFLSVPQGLADAGFDGYVEVVAWQGLGAAVDQINISRNRGKAVELAERIRDQRRMYPDAPIHLVALSAGTGIATFALEYLPERERVGNVVFLGCSLSSRYDMTRALKRIKGHLFVFYSEKDAILTRIVPYTGTIDRTDASDGIAGLHGFKLPHGRATDTVREYKRVKNIPYQERFADAGYEGGHMDSTSRDFVARFVAPLLLDLRGSTPVESDPPPRPRRRLPPEDVAEVP